MEKEPKKQNVKTKPRKKKKAPKKGQEKLLSVLKTVCIISVVLALLVIAAQRFGDITFSSVSDYFNTLISGAKSGDGYPYYFESLAVKKVLPIEKDLFVLSDDAGFVLDNTARTLGKEEHTLSSPLSVSAGGRVLTLDVGEHSYRVQSKTKLLYEGSFPQKLLTGAISKSGAIALASRGDSSQTKLTVLNKHQKEVFTWNCANENIIALALSDNGKRVAVSVVGAADGELYSKVYLFDTSKNDPLLSLSYTGIVPHLSFLSGDYLLVAGNKVFELYKGNEKIAEEDLSVNTFSHLYTSDSKYAIAAFSKYGSASSKIIKAYDRKGNLLFTVELNESIKGVSTDGQSFSVLSDNALYNYDREGALIGKVPIEAGCILPFTDGKWTYVWTVGGIERFKTNRIDEGEEPSTSAPEEITDNPFKEDAN